MGCGCIFMTPYEKCAFLLKDYNKLIIQRKLLINKKEIKEKKKTDKKELNYRLKIFKNLENINKKHLTNIEVEKLKQLNDLFIVLLTEESDIKKKCDSINNIEGNELINNNDILIVNPNKIKGKNHN